MWVANERGCLFDFGGQAIHDVRYGVIRPSMEDLVSLAGLQMQVDFKDHDPSKYTKDFLA